jgi:hypothetical protein
MRRVLAVGALAMLKTSARALFVVLVLVGCGNTRPVRRSPSLAVVSRDRSSPDLSCPHLPAAVGGFRLGSDSSIGRAGSRCIHEGYEWTELIDGATCSSAPMRVIYPASVRLVSCGSRVCAVQLRYEFGGDTALRDGVHRLHRELTEQYGEGRPNEDGTMACPRVEGDEFACVLDGVGIAQFEWLVADPREGPLACEQEPTALVALRAQGDRGTHDGLVTVTYVTADGIEAFRRTYL